MILCVLNLILPTSQFNTSQSLSFNSLNYGMNLLHFSIFSPVPSQKHIEVQVFLVQVPVSILFIQLFFKFPIDKVQCGEIHAPDIMSSQWRVRLFLEPRRRRWGLSGEAGQSGQSQTQAPGSARGEQSVETPLLTMDLHMHVHTCAKSTSTHTCIPYTQILRNKTTSKKAKFSS